MSNQSQEPIRDEELHAYVDGRLDGPRREAVERYLEAQPEEAERTRAYGRQRAMMKDALRFKVDEPVPARLRPQRLGSRRAPYLGGARGALAAAAMVTVFGLGLGGGWAARDFNAGDERIDIAVGAHRVFVADARRPVEIRADAQDQLERWLSNRLERRIVVPDLGGAGLRFMGGRLIPTPNGPAAQLMYDDDAGTRVTLFVEAAPSSERAPRQEEVDGVDVVFWADAQFRYTLAAQTQRSRVAEIGALVREQLPADGRSL